MDVIAELERHGVRLTEIRAWTMCYYPFVMGGSVWQPGGAKVPCERPVQIGEFFVCEIRGPEGMTAVCEVTTGAVVGDTIEQVTQDIVEAEDRGDLEIMREQIRRARDQMSTVRSMSPEEFWRRMASARRKEDRLREAMSSAE